MSKTEGGQAAAPCRSGKNDCQVNAKEITAAEERAKWFDVIDGFIEDCQIRMSLHREHGSRKGESVASAKIKVLQAFKRVIEQANLDEYLRAFRQMADPDEGKCLEDHLHDVRAKTISDVLSEVTKTDWFERLIDASGSTEDETRSTTSLTDLKLK